MKSFCFTDAYELCDTSNGWELVNNACFKFYDTPTTWYGARSSCQHDGADLFLPTDSRMLYSINDEIACRTTKEQAWIGLSDTARIRQIIQCRATTTFRRPQRKKEELGLHSTSELVKILRCPFWFCTTPSLEIITIDLRSL